MGEGRNGISHPPSMPFVAVDQVQGVTAAGQKHGPFRTGKLQRHLPRCQRGRRFTASSLVQFDQGQSCGIAAIASGEQHMVAVDSDCFRAGKLVAPLPRRFARDEVDQREVGVGGCPCT